MPQFPLNPSHTSGKTTRALVSGKDAALYTGDGELLLSVESFNVQINFQNATFQPLGSPLQSEFMLGYSVEITITEAIVESSMFVQGALEFANVGRHAPSWVLATMIAGYNGSAERIIFRDCVLTGTLNLGDVSPGDVIKRSITLACNQAPELQEILSIGD